MNAPLKERVYMKLPPGVLNLGKECKVCHSLKGLYGLHQAGRGWYKEMAGVFVNKLGFKKSAVNHSVFYWRTKDKHTVVMVATDDVAITSKWLQDVEKLKNKLRQHWKISNLGELTWYLGFWAHWDWNVRTIAINQQSYIKGMLEKFWLTSVKPISTPMDPGTKFSNEQYLLTLMQLVKMCGVPYTEAIGSVLWPVMILRPDCAFTVSTLAQFIQNPMQAHWEAVKRVLVYLGTTCTLWLTFSVKWTDKLIVRGYCNMGWVGQPHWHLISGYLFHISQGAVILSSKKQYIIVLWSTELEYIALAHATKEGLWMHAFLLEIQDVPREMMGLSSDNQGAITLSKDNKLHQHTKHIDIHYHFIHEAVEDGQIRMNYVPTDQNPTVIFTKPLLKMKFCGFVAGLGLKPWREEGKHDVSSWSDQHTS